MSEQNMQSVSTFKPTIWHKLGFRHAYASPLPEDPLWHGAGIAGSVTILDWKDRLRILLTGCIEIEMRLQTDVPTKQIRSSAGFGVVPRKWAAPRLASGPERTP